MSRALAETDTPASIVRFPSQAGALRADSQGGFGMGGTQDARAYVGGGGFGLWGGQACSNEYPSQCLQRLKKPVGGERSCNGGPTTCAPLNNNTLFYGVLGFFRKHSQLWSFLLLSLQTVFSQPASVPSLGLSSKPHFPAPFPPSQQETHDSGWNVQCCCTDHVCSFYFFQPSTDHLLHSPLIPKVSFCCR